jgi:hypothetical protein
MKPGKRRAAFDPDLLLDETVDAIQIREIQALVGAHVIDGATPDRRNVFAASGLDPNANDESVCFVFQRMPAA